MIALIVANVRRRTARTALTAAGVAVGVAAVVALLALSAGLNRTAGQLIHLGRADVGLFQSGAADPTSSTLPLSLLPKLREQPEVLAAAPIQLVVGALHEDPSAIVFGIQPSGFVAHLLVFIRGGGLRHGDVDVGDLLARQLHLRLGQTVRLDRTRYTVGGIFHSGIQFEDLGLMTTLGDAQALAGRTSDEATTIAVRFKPGVSSAEGTKDLSHAFRDIEVIADAGEAVRAGANSELISKAVLLIVVLALIIGGLSVANTMLAAVLERRRELVLLSTLGWSPLQLATLVLGEAVLVSVIGTAAGLVLGLMAGQLLPEALGLQSFISPELSAWVLGRAALIGVTIGVTGAIYPTWRATRAWSASALAPG